MSVSEIENPLFHPETGAELQTAEEVEAARQWYRQSKPQAEAVQDEHGE